MKELIGLDSDSARKRLENKEYRIVRIDGKGLIITCDFNPDRLNLEIENKDGVLIIVNVYGG